MDHRAALDLGPRHQQHLAPKGDRLLANVSIWGGAYDSFGRAEVLNSQAQKGPYQRGNVLRDAQPQLPRRNDALRCIRRGHGQLDILRNTGIRLGVHVLAQHDDEGRFAEEEGGLEGVRVALLYALAEGLQVAHAELPPVCSCGFGARNGPSYGERNERAEL